MNFEEFNKGSEKRIQMKTFQKQTIQMKITSFFEFR